MIISIGIGHMMTKQAVSIASTALWCHVLGPWGCFPVLGLGSVGPRCAGLWPTAVSVKMSWL